MAKKLKKFTEKTLAELINMGLLDKHGYLLTPHFLIVPIEKEPDVYQYLYKNGYITVAENRSEYSAIYINE